MGGVAVESVGRHLSRMVLWSLAGAEETGGRSGGLTRRKGWKEGDPRDGLIPLSAVDKPNTQQAKFVETLIILSPLLYHK